MDHVSILAPAMRLGVGASGAACTDCGEEGVCGGPGCRCWVRVGRAGGRKGWIKGLRKEAQAADSPMKRSSGMLAEGPWEARCRG